MDVKEGEPGVRNVALDAIRARLVEARNFVEVGVVVCELGRTRFHVQCAVILTTSKGRPVLSVDNLEIDDEQRLAYCRRGWESDPMFRELLLRGWVVGDVHTRIHPMFSDHGVLGVVRFGNRRRFTRVQRDDLSVLSNHAAVRLARLGVTTLVDSPLTRLTPRQRNVAELVGENSNVQIAAQLGVELDTVKKHLKDVYAKLGIQNTEDDLADRGVARERLKQLLAQPVPRHDIPFGVSRFGDFAITRP